MNTQEAVEPKKNVFKVIAKILGIFLTVVLVLFFGFRIYINSNYVNRFISGSSMEPTFSGSAGEYHYLYMKKIDSGTKIKRFDIVALHYQKNANGQWVDWIKRVIGLPNENIKYVKGQLYINDKIVNELFVDSYYFAEFDYELTLEKDEYFVIGDNRLVTTKGKIQRKYIYAINGFIYKTCNQPNKSGMGLLESGCKITYKKIG